MANRFTTFPESWWEYMPKPFKLLSDDLNALEAIYAPAGVVRCVWDGTGTPTRPNAPYVDWLSPVDPSQWMQPGDTWTTTAQL